MCKELKEIADILRAEDYRVYQDTGKKIVIRDNKFGTLFKLEFWTSEDGWDKDTYVLKSSDEFQYFCTTHKGEVLNLIYFVSHCMKR
jgi:hypothetical protein